MQTIVLSGLGDLAELAARMVAAALASPDAPVPSYSATPAEAFQRSSAAARFIPPLPTLSKPGPVGAAFTFPESPLTFTVGLSKETTPDGQCLHLSISARGLVGVVEFPPDEELSRVVSAFSPELTRSPPEGALSFVHHYRAPLPQA